MKSANPNQYIKQVNIYQRKMPLWLKALLKALFVLFIVLLACVAVFSFVYTCVPVSGDSMYATLIGGSDSVYVNRYAESTYENIIVVMRKEDDGSTKYLVKRVYAFGGDKIALKQKSNGTGYEISVIKASTGSTLTYDARGEGGKTFENFNRLKTNDNWKNHFQVINSISYLVVPDDCIFYLGDNWANSLDCSSYGPVQKSNYVGRVDIIVPGSKDNLHYIFKYLTEKLF